MNAAGVAYRNSPSFTDINKGITGLQEGATVQGELVETDVAYLYVQTQTGQQYVPIRAPNGMKICIEGQLSTMKSLPSGAASADIDSLKQQMRAAVEAEDFEQAAVIKVQLDAARAAAKAGPVQRSECCWLLLATVCCIYCC